MKRIFLKVGSKRDGRWKVEAGRWKLEGKSSRMEGARKDFSFPKKSGWKRPDEKLEARS